MNPITILAGVVAAVAPSIPNAVECVWHYLTEDIPIGSDKHVYKKRDTHKFTPAEISFIKYKYREYLVQKRDPNGFKWTQTDLVEGLNNDLGLTKSVTSYRNVWGSKK